MLFQQILKNSYFLPYIPLKKLYLQKTIYFIGFNAIIRNIFEFIVKFSYNNLVSFDSLQGKGNFLLEDNILITFPFINK